MITNRKIGAGARDSKTRIEAVFAALEANGFTRNQLEYDGVNQVIGHITVGKDVEIVLYEVGDKEVQEPVLNNPRKAHGLTVADRTKLRDMVNNL